MTQKVMWHSIFPQTLEPPEPGEVHLWSMSNSELSVVAPEPNDILSLAEIERRDAFVIRDDGLKFARSRSFLKHLLAAYLDAGPRGIGFSHLPEGKPALMQSDLAQSDLVFDLKFNTSRTKDRLAIGISNARDIGIDIEQRAASRDVLSIARRFFSPGECATLETLGGDQRQQAFIRCWTRKEALMKADGRGMKLVPDIRPGLMPLTREFEIYLLEGVEYAFTDLDLDQNCCATVALIGASIEVRKMTNPTFTT